MPGLRSAARLERVDGKRRRQVAVGIDLREELVGFLLNGCDRVGPGNPAQRAETVLATLDGVNAATLHAFAAGLKHANGPAWHFHLAVSYLAGNRERGEPPDGLTMLTMRSALRDASRDSAFIDRLETAKAPFWIAARTALVVISETQVAEKRTNGREQHHRLAMQ